MHYCQVCFIVLQLLVSVFGWSMDRYDNRVLRSPVTVLRHRRTQMEVRTNQCMFNICEEVPLYPEDKIRAMIEENQSLHSYFGSSVIEPSSFDSGISIVSRNNAVMEPFCKTRDVSSTPKLMMDVDHVERSIANTNKYKQVIKYQICDFEEGESCFPGSILNLKTRCLQKFNVIKLMTANLDSNTLEYRKFEIPSTCVCTYTKEA
ncbi:spatzle 7 [Tribolium castaneum]|uniref:Spatzle 7 n=1 Tax=Tribolium castaneum TaxID=7070 RepID=D6W9U8_TRICA|nr:PREDICTED: uncharacterized protein LOC103315107 [Tribolium castaneum]EEZ99267.2 spatzle 7 [Tribolium castaneum]|eukprot:XP_008201183.1 PREDICTED: uncharacterized protein LOC103315107 [Tribolium castaneum]